MAFEELIRELDARKQRALAMGGPEKLADRKAQGLLNARERIARLFDAAELRLGEKKQAVVGIMRGGDGRRHDRRRAS